MSSVALLSCTTVEVDSLDRSVSCTTLQRGVSTVADATINPGFSSGSATTIYTGSTSLTAAQNRALIAWDVSSIPAGSIVVSASVTLRFNRTVIATSDVRLHRATSPWTEAAPSWATTYDPAVLGSFTTGAWTGTRTIDVTAAVADWIAGGAPNHGLLFEEDAGTRTGIVSSEASTQAYRPQLAVCWESGAPDAGVPDAGPPDAPPPDGPPIDAPLPDAAIADAAPPDAPAPDAAPPVPPADAGPSPPESYRIAAIADYGAEGAGLEQVAALVASWNPDAIIAAGDHVYESGCKPDRFARIVGSTGGYGPWVSAGRFFATTGNHDIGCDNGVAYDAYFGHPRLPGGERVYDAPLVPSDLVHVFVADSEAAYTTSTSPQGTWLLSRLAMSDSCFDIVSFHQPGVTSSLGQGPKTSMRWPFRQNGADLVVQGHMHGYERLNDQGLTHVTVGTAGGPLWGSWTNIAPESVYRYPITPTSWGATLITVSRSGSIGDMRIEFWPVGATAPADSHTITKSCP